jgi:dipeptidyl aminopeptidase/acylaminoacyl peptidase
VLALLTQASLGSYKLSMGRARRFVHLRLGICLGSVVASALVASAGASSAGGLAGPAQFVIQTSTGRIEALDVRGHLVRPIGHSSNGLLALSSDRSELAWLSSKGLVVARVSSGTPRLLRPEPQCNDNKNECLIEDAAWSPDGSQLLVSGLGPQRTHLEIVAASTGHGRTIATGPGFAVTGWSPNGKWMIYEVLPPFGQAIRLVLARGDGSSPRTIVRFPKAEVGASAAWSPDSREVAFTDVPSSHAFEQLHLYSIATGRVRHLASARIESGVAWSPDSRRLALGLEYGGTEIVALANGEKRILHAGGVPLAGDPAWTLSGLYMSGLHGIWRSPDGRSKPVRLFTHLPVPPDPPAYLDRFEPLH